MIFSVLMLSGVQSNLLVFIKKVLLKSFFLSNTLLYYSIVASFVGIALLFEFMVLEKFKDCRVSEHLLLILWWYELVSNMIFQGKASSCLDRGYDNSYFLLAETVQVKWVYSFHALALFLYPLKTSENLWCSVVFKAYRKRAVTRN